MSLDAMATPIPFVAAGTAFTGTCELRGFTVLGTTAENVTIYDNTAASGTILAVVTLAAATATTIVIPTGLRAAIGLHVASGVGALSGSVWIA